MDGIGYLYFAPRLLNDFACSASGHDGSIGTTDSSSSGSPKADDLGESLDLIIHPGLTARVGGREFFFFFASSQFVLARKSRHERVELILWWAACDHVVDLALISLHSTRI